ncbi:hypothetical protein AAFF_G00369020 [Aldrovandia affinis]|uniref:Uncharacterized protein n=1 Tax=Aldrovandia affinis TaxID=143900 RepID=A0AAD7SH51_9TELE|nr:hypothetical protein AAFF_G00369020 [Aldrovandia affinis]
MCRRGLTVAREVLYSKAHCPAGWVHFDRSCYRALRKGKPWAEAGRACSTAATGAHLADVETEEEFLFISSYLGALNHIVLLWTSLNDLQHEGELRWSSGAAYSLISVVTSSLPANQTDCFALQTNATGPNYFFTGFFCYMPLPYMCQYKMPAAPSRFAFVLEEVSERVALFGWSDLERWLQVEGAMELFVQYREDTPLDRPRRRVVSPNATRVAMQGLSPGRAYLFSLRVRHRSGATQTFGSVLKVLTRPNPPQNITASRVTSTELAVHWTAPDPSHNALFHQYLVSWEDVATGVRESLSLENYTTSTVIGGLEPYRIFELSSLTPGGTYEIGVEAVRNENRSEAKTIVQTLRPKGVEVAMPYEVNTHSVVLFVQRPVAGIFDGIKVIYKGGSKHKALSEGDDKIIIDNLTPGMLYEFSVYTTSGRMTSTVYKVSAVKTCLAPPTNVREGVVRDSSVEILWDEAEGQRKSYEVICVNCAASVTVQKVTEGRAVFTDLLPGQVYNFSVRTEKESFGDSPQVFCEIRAVPSAAEWLPFNKTSTSLTVSWAESLGVIDGFILSITNTTFTEQKSFTAFDQRIHRFESLSPGSDYRIDLISTSGEKKSLPATLNMTTVPAVPEDVTLIEQEGDSMYLTWRHPQGQVEGYQLRYGVSTAPKKHRRVTVRDSSIRIKDLTPGTEYQFTLRSFKGAETSEAVSKHVLTRPARVCSLSLTHVNSSSAGVVWEPAAGPFDHYRLTVANASVERELNVSRENLAYAVSGLQDGCTYNVTVDRVRSGVRGVAASLTVTTGCVDGYHVVLSPEQGLVTVRSLGAGGVQLCAWSASTARYDRFARCSLSPSLSDAPSLPLPGVCLCVRFGEVSCTVGDECKGCAEVVFEVSGATSPVSRSITTNESTPGTPTNLVGERVGSTGILLSWTTPADANGKIQAYAVEYKEVCPYPESSFNRIQTPSEIPEYLLNTLTPGSTYNIKVAAINNAGIGLFSRSLFFKTAEAPPGLVTNITAFAANHSAVKVTWFLPKRTNGLITKFSVKAKHARTSQTVKTLEIDAEEIMNGVLPHCNDAADILSRGTPSPSETTLITSASLSPFTMSAVPSASSWIVPISVVVDQLRSHTAYVFEVSAFTSDGEGQIASYMVRMPESAASIGEELCASLCWAGLVWPSPLFAGSGPADRVARAWFGRRVKQIGVWRTAMGRCEQLAEPKPQDIHRIPSGPAGHDGKSHTKPAH